MKRFFNLTNQGNEKAIKHGRTLPNQSVNLAWTKVDPLSPHKNVVIVDTSQFTGENITRSDSRCRLYYANHLGILEDINGNQIIEDQYPAISDVFKADEDWTTTPGSEYTTDDVLPYVHVSRYFYLDWAGIIPTSAPFPHRTGKIRVVDSLGRDYVDDKGKQRYKTHLAPVQSAFEDGSGKTEQAYRIHVYIDEDSNEDLYLIYNKVEISCDGKTIENYELNYKETLNPQPYFEFEPEESVIVDPANRDKKWFSSKPINFKDQILGLNKPGISGYQIYVPRKAVGDPRRFQLFRWRVACTFTQEYKVDTARAEMVRCGVVVTNADPTSRTPYAFLNLMRSGYNASGVTFVNPISEAAVASAPPETDVKEEASYWYVNIDQATNAQLKEFDILIWSPTVNKFNFAPYAAKIDYFTNTLGGTLLIDTNNVTVPESLWDLTTTAGVSPWDGNKLNEGPTGYVDTSTLYVPGITNMNWTGSEAATPGGRVPAQSATPIWPATPNLNDDIITISEELFTNALGGWNIDDIIDDDESKTLTYLLQSYGPGRGKAQYVDTHPITFNRIATALNYPYYGHSVYTTLEKQTTASHLPNNATAASAVVPSVPVAGHGREFEKVIIRFYRKWSGPNGSKAYVKLTGPDVEVGSGIITATANGGYVTGEYVSTDPSIIGETLTSTWHVAEDSVAIPDVNVTEGGIIVTTFYRQWTIAAQTNQIIGVDKSVLVYRGTAGGGHQLFTTLGILFSCSALWSFNSAALISANTDSRIYQEINYNNLINSSIVEGAMKFLYNVVLLSVKERILDGRIVNEYSSSWDVVTPWKASWVINARDGILADYEIQRHNFELLPKDVNDLTPVWQRKLANTSIKDLVDEVINDTELEEKVRGATRKYRIEVTNLAVETSSILGDNSKPYAWTEAYSPSFKVPHELGPHIIKEEEVVGDYASIERTHKVYPPKPYSAQLRVTNNPTSEFFNPQTVNWDATGSATETYDVDQFIPASTKVIMTIARINWTGHGYGGYAGAGHTPYIGASVPGGIWYQQEFNYRAYESWPHWGIFGRYGSGSRGDVVAFIQHAMNKFVFFGFMPGPGLRETGYYDGATAAAVRRFQVTMGAKYIDGVVDAETLSIIGAQIVRGGAGLMGTSGYFGWALGLAGPNKRWISDGANHSVFQKRSWVTGGPSAIAETFFFALNQEYTIHTVNFTPSCHGNELILSVNILPLGHIFSAAHYDPWRGIGVGAWWPNQNEYVAHTGARRGQLIAATVYANAPVAGTGARVVGVADLNVNAEVPTTVFVPAHWDVRSQVKTVAIFDSGTVELSGENDFYLDTVPSYVKMYEYAKGQKNARNSRISNIRWESVTTDNTNVRATITPKGYIHLSADEVQTAYTNEDFTQYTFGPVLGQSSDLTYYFMDEHGKVNPVPEMGWVSKNDGTKLLCDVDGKPVGFTNIVPGEDLFPTGTGPNDTQRHFTKMKIDTFGRDAFVIISFFDKNRQEFIVNAAGEPEISYVEYIERGPQNIYIAVLTTYDLDINESVPVEGDVPLLPYRWAMPVYGVCRKENAHITLEPIPPNLSIDDVWPVAVRSGKFNRSVHIRPTSEGYLTGYLANYQGETLFASYRIVEAVNSDWSLLHGPPNADIKYETPIILDDDVIQVRQAPILATLEPSKYIHENPSVSGEYQPGVFGSWADPVRPFFTVYQRATLGSAWEALSWADIKDYNLSTGEITLETKLINNDPNLIRVDYTSRRRHYYFKYFNNQMINLNPYPGGNNANAAIYIYIVPEYVKDASGNIIPESPQTTTLRFTNSPDIFNYLRPEYDPLVVQLGVIYITTALNVEDLSIVDSRRRGGAVLDSVKKKDIMNRIEESFMYWDIGHGQGMSYQKGGFVIIRLPEQLKVYMSEKDIRDIIDRNITAGVRYELQDLTGNQWSAE